MVWNTEELLIDKNGNPVPQFLGPDGKPQALLGRNGANRVEFYGPDGNPISSTSGKLDVRAAEVEAILGEVQAEPTANTVLDRLLKILQKLEAGVAISGSLPSFATRNPADLATRGFESRIYSRSGTIAANTEEVMADLSGGETHMEAFTLGTNSKANAEIIIKPYLSNGTLSAQKMVIANANGLYIEPITVEKLVTSQNGENDLFKVQVQDDQNSEYSMIMKRQARFGNGLKVSIKNRDAENAINLACTVMLYKQRA